MDIPNFQNIPIRTETGREVRKAFVPQGNDWVILSADYSQVELRIMAHYSQEPELISAFAEDADIHNRTAALVNGISESEVTPFFSMVVSTGINGISISL